MENNDFSQALTTWMNDTGRTDAVLAAELTEPEISYSAVARWRRGEVEPRRSHRRQLIKLSKGKIKQTHFV